MSSHLLSYEIWHGNLFNCNSTTPGFGANLNSTSDVNSMVCITVHLCSLPSFVSRMLCIGMRLKCERGGWGEEWRRGWGCTMLFKAVRQQREGLRGACNHLCSQLATSLWANCWSKAAGLLQCCKRKSAPLCSSHDECQPFEAHQWPSIG